MASGAVTKLQRLGRMDLSEVAGRTRMEASKWWDRVAAGDARGQTSRDARGCRRRMETFRAVAAERFFAGAMDDRTAELVTRRWPESVAAVTARARQAAAGRFDLLGYRGLSFGEPIDWRLDPVSGRRAPLVHWTRVDPLAVASVGDSKVVWELNRHQWLVGLGQAYRFTGDERHAEAFAAYVGHWLDANPVGQGINWTSSLELALRLMAWCWCLALFRDSPALRSELFGRMEASIEDHARHVERYLSRYFSPNTHLTGEALGLVYAGTLFPDLAPARRWRETGARVLADATERQVLADGVYFEQSTCYQRYTAEILLHFLILTARHTGDVPRAIRDRLRHVMDFLRSIRLPGGEAPAIGDADGGWLLPLTPRSPGDLRGVFAPAAVVCGRADYAWAAGGAAPEIVWLLGEGGLAEVEAMRSQPSGANPSRLFADGGYAVMRDGETEGHQMIFDVGPLGCPVSGGHGHADLLSIQCAAFGEPFLVDPGTGTYADRGWRDFFRGTGAHNTVVIDGAGQAVPARPFSWRQRPRARLRQWISDDRFDLADADHDAYARLSEPVRHRRRVLFVKPRYWVLFDDIEGGGSHRIDLRFQFAPVAVAIDGEQRVRAAAAGRGLIVQALARVPLELRLRRGSLAPAEGWVSPDYGRWHPSPVAVYTATARLPQRLVTLILPIGDPAGAAPELRPVLDDRGELVGCAIGEGEAVLERADGTLCVE